jgi:hypothetical protein
VHPAAGADGPRGARTGKLAKPVTEASLELCVAKYTGWTPDHVGWHVPLPKFWHYYLSAQLTDGVRMVWPDGNSTAMGVWAGRMRGWLAARGGVWRSGEREMGRRGEGRD